VDCFGFDCFSAMGPGEKGKRDSAPSTPSSGIQSSRPREVFAHHKNL